MGKGGCLVVGSGKENLISWEEIKKHTHKDDSWIVIGDSVYDVSKWMKKHPGGARILHHHAGQDATVVAYCLHNHLVDLQIILLWSPGYRI